MTQPMTLRDLIQIAGGNPALTLGLLAVPCAASLAAGLLHERGQGGQSPWKHIYAAIVYATCLPGTFAASLIVYTALFTRENLLDAGLVAYFGPIAAMVLCLALTRRNVNFDEVPGFDKIWGLLGVLGVSFTVALAIQKTRIWIFFGGSIWILVASAAALFVFFRWSLRRMLGPGNFGRP